jgi:SNF2 family DNA or RNA helicase
MLTLASYQQEAKDFLLDHPRAGLFMGMGLGKTVTVLSALREAFLLGDVTAALIVAPLRVITLTWPAEVETHGFDFKVASLRTKAGWEAIRKGDAQIYLINYDALPALVEFLRKAKQLPFDCVVFDELTRAKSPGSRRINAFRRLLIKHKTPIRWGLTGTPAPNSYTELFAQIRLLDDGARLGKAYDDFEARWFEPENRHSPYPKMVPRANAKKDIESKIAGMTLTIRTSDHLDLPEIAEEDIEVSLPDEVCKAYREAEKNLLLQVDEGQIEIANAAVLSGKLLQICSGAVYDEDRNTCWLHDKKLDALEDLRKEGRLLVACNFIHERERIVKRFMAVDFNAARNDKEQMAIVAAWNAGKIQMLLADPRSAGHGLNLQHGGSSVVWFSPNYSRELYDQMNARLFRRGQINAVKVFRVVAKDTVDEAVVTVLSDRGASQDGLMAALKMLQKMRKTPAV